MDRVRLITSDNTTYLINDPTNEGHQRIKGTHSHAINSIDSAVFSIYADNPYFANAEPRKSLVVVGEDADPKFIGRIISRGNNVTQDGDVYKECTCEGYMGFLHDYTPGVRTPMSKLSAEIQAILDLYHTSIAMSKTPLDICLISASVQAYLNTDTPTIEGFETMDAYDYLYALIEAAGLEWYVDEFVPQAPEASTPACVNIGLTAEHATLRTGKISLGDNLISFIETENSADVCTIITAYGAKAYTDLDNSERIGPVYVTPTDTSYRTKYGDLRKAIIFDECTDQATLQTTAQSYIDDLNASTYTVNIQAVDPVYMGVTDELIQVGDVVEVVVPLYGFDSPVRVNSITECIEDVSQNTYTFTTIDAAHSYWYTTVEQRRESQRQRTADDRITSAIAISNMTYNTGESNYQITTGRLDTVDETLTAYAGRFTTLETQSLKVDGELEAHTGKISTLESDNVTIKDTLIAHNVELDTLTANDVTINNTLTAQSGKISTLESDNVTIKDTLIAHNAELDTLTANDVTITGELGAHTGKISTLESDNVTINSKLTAQAGEFETLKSKSVTTDNLTTNIATIDVAKVGSTFTQTLQTFSETSAKSVIDSAYIYNAIVNKLTVGDLTAMSAKTQVLSLITKDNMVAIGFKNATQQFYDKNGKVRVQIGQDANSNFNFAVIGSDGTTCLYDETGVKASALADNIIVTDMIADDAVTEDKVSFEFIKPNAQGGIDITQIYDGKGGLWGAEYTSFTETTNTNIATAQSTADTAKTNAATAQSTANTAKTNAATAQSTANTAKTNAATAQSTADTANANITTLTNTVSSVSSKVDANAKSITDKVWQSDITTSINSYDGTTGKTIRDRVTTVETNIDGITSTVSDMQSIGGRNLAEGTNQGTKNWYWHMKTGGTTLTEVVENGVSTCKIVRDSVAQTGWSVINYMDIGRDKWEPNTEYVVSICVKASVVTTFTPMFLVGNNTYTLIQSCDSINNTTVANKWVKLSWKVKSLETLPSQTDQLSYFVGMDPSSGVTYQFKDFKIEKGSVCTDWSPAPEDIDVKISTVSQTADKINWLVKSGTSSSDVTLTDRAYSVIADNINLTGKVTFSSLDSTAQGKITTAQSTADTAKTNAATAQSTADGIKTNIYTSGTTTIDGAKITTGSIKAEKIDVNELFSKAITATNLSITGGNISILAGYSEEKAIGVTYQSSDGYHYVSSNLSKTGISYEFVSGQVSVYSKTKSSLCVGGLEIDRTIKESSSSGAIQTTFTFKQSDTYGFFANCGINADGGLYESGTALSAKYAKKAYTCIATVKGATAVSLSSSYTEFLVYVGEGSGTYFACTFYFTRDSVNGTVKRLRNGGYKNSSENSNFVICTNSDCSSMWLEEAATNGTNSTSTTNVMVFGR